MFFLIFVCDETEKKTFYDETFLQIDKKHFLRISFKYCQDGEFLRSNFNSI